MSWRPQTERASASLVCPSLCDFPALTQPQGGAAEMERVEQKDHKVGK